VNIRLDKLKARPRQVVIDEPVEGFPVLNEVAEREGLEFVEPIKGRCLATWAGDVVEVTGRLQSRVKAPCGRCLEEVEQTLHVDVLLCYVPEGRKARDDSAAIEVELDEDDLGLIVVQGDEIDLRTDLAQELVMALPVQILCDEGCDGLCPVCGVNRNLAVCTCERPQFHSSLAELKNFKAEK